LALTDVTAELGELDATAIVVDHSSAFAAFTLTGDVLAAMSRLTLNDSALPGFAQGLVAGVAAKTIALPECVHLLVSSTYADSVRARILSVCADLDVEEGVTTARVPAESTAVT
jgi:hypothetical protein